MYTLLTSFPSSGCGNTGDKLIEEAFAEILGRVRGETEFLTVFREDDLTGRLEEINRTRAVLIMAFPIRDVPMYPGVVRLTEDLSNIKVPLIPVAANWNVYPGDIHDRKSVRYSEQTADFLRYISAQCQKVSVREYYTGEVLKRHGVDNITMTGCPTWYDFKHMGKPMRRPQSINRLVFTPPMSYYYAEQGKSVLTMLAELFPQSEKICCFICGDCRRTPLPEGAKCDNSVAMNPEIAEKNADIARHAEALGFGIVDASFDTARLGFIDDCDLHVGYDCHGNISFLRRRIPSVLIAEDARGVGFNYTLGVPEICGFMRAQPPRIPYVRPLNTSGYCDGVAAYTYAPADVTLAERVRELLLHQLDGAFSRYAGVADFIDETYEKSMLPFVRDMP